jgi:hypothetical protein
MATYGMHSRMPYRVPLPKLGPSPTPITEYLAAHPDVSLMSLAKTSGLNYATVCSAERGCNPPTFVTMLKLQTTVGIPVMAWAGTKAVQVHMTYRVDPHSYNDKQNTWRRKKRAEDPVHAAKQVAREKRNQARMDAKKRGESVPPLPMSPLRARMLGLTP